MRGNFATLLFYVVRSNKPWAKHRLIIVINISDCHAPTSGQSQIHHMNEAHQGGRGCRPLATSDRKPNESSGLILRRAYFKIIYEMTRPSTEAAYLGGKGHGMV